ncbi:MAG TPA: MBOAT family O-acyltransferase, partial [Candidatus Krumholzibacteria bacterium]|nr:MBOAT family O-acyltransferase [Candidatus Krumholzibacteria bacterium]
MIFNSLTFVVFFAVVLGLHSLPLPWRVKKFNLLVASYVFYAAWNPPFVILLWLSTIVDWFASRWMYASPTRRSRRLLMLASLVTNLGLLGFFKYGTFLLDNFVVLMRAFGVEYSPPASHIVLPVGISFYTFQTLSYTLDVYRGRCKPWDSGLDFALYVTFFPQLVAGPIVRATDFLPQLVEPKRASGRYLSWGLTLLAIGLFEKMILADSICAPVSDMVYSATAQAGMLDAWIGTLAFSAQIFFDFSGYSTCAIGAAMCLGFALPDNFLYPYGAVGFSDFWRRWHISLSTWLRDYLYIPLGGNRKGNVNVNLMTTMLLGGLWHGAGWTFVAWGGLHGAYLVGERGARRLWGEAAWVRRELVRFALGVATYVLVCFTWVFFRAHTFADAWRVIRAMLGGGHGSLSLGLANSCNIALLTVCLVFGHWYMRQRTLEDVARVFPWW